MIEVLNSLRITPDVLTWRMPADRNDLETRYEKTLEFVVRRPPLRCRLDQDWSIVVFNNIVRRTARNYDVLIDSSNSFLGLPSDRVMSFMHFPRKARIDSGVPDIHEPDRPFPRGLLPKLRRSALRLIYNRKWTAPRYGVVCISDFTRRAVKETFAIDEDFPVIYPPVEVRAVLNESPERHREVASLARFTRGKKQVEQIEIAKELPEFDVHLMGFADTNRAYYRSCVEKASEPGVGNVHLHPNASHSDVVERLRRSKYFLHTMINEPFGISTVQAIASGCIPIVHDSGGQKEVVPDPRLRYSDIREVPQKIREVEGMGRKEVHELVRRLQDHVVESYDEEVFRARFREYLLERLPIPI